MPTRPALQTRMAIASAVGVVIAIVDSGPGFDATGSNAVSLAAAAAVLTAIEPRPAWLWAILIATWTPALEIPTTGNLGSIASLGFGAAGAAVG